MALAPEDVETIGRLLDERLARVEARRRRRFWVLVLVSILLFVVLPALLSWWFAARWIQRLETAVAEQEVRFQEAKAEYLAELRRSEQLRAERTAAEQAVGYRTGRTRAEYEAGLLATAVRLIGKQGEIARMAEGLASDDPEAMMDAVERMAAVQGEALGALGQMLLRNTDPAHATPQERLLSGVDGGEPPAAGTPLVGTGPAPAGK